ncbi:DUF6882 domain-containing protein [Brevibacterium renqingii]|uniref:DUF6882 domain-containing protein n=1 Tax=Brevibacterium renqingii TaxID=2776916 RepID=UPI001AE012FC|nr:DUF6882 domain-containing protein [Brevibacterium renqingii]
MSTTLQDLVNRAVFYSTEVQTHFGGLIADAEWEVDFTADPHLTFSTENGVVLRARPHLLGSESSRDKTWLWGWENVNDFPEAVVGLSHDVRKFGAAEEVTELTTSELDLDEELALRLTLAAKEATGKWAHYPAEAGAGTTVWLLVDADALVLPQPQVKVSVRALMQGLTQTTVSDHRAAIESYVAKRGIPVEELPAGGLRMLFADGSADLSFDDERRISNCDMNTPLEGEAAEQYAKAAAGAPAEVGTESTAPRPDSTVAPTPAQSVAAGDESVHHPAEAAGSSAVSDSSAPHAEDESAPELVDEAVTTEAPAARSEADTGEPERHAAEETGTEPAPAETDTESAARDEEETPAEKPKKKGLFSKLFGR